MNTYRCTRAQTSAAQKSANVQGTSPLCHPCPVVTQKEIMDSNMESVHAHGTCVTSTPTTEQLFDQLWEYSQADEYDPDAMDYLTNMFDLFSKLDAENKVLPGQYSFDLSTFKNAVASSCGTSHPIRFHEIPIYRIMLEPAVRDMPRTRKWLSSMVHRAARRASESCADLLGYPLAFKDLRHHMKDFFVDKEGPFNPGKVLRSSMIKRVSQKTFFGIGEEILLKSQDSFWDDARSVLVLDFEEGGTEDSDDIKHVLENVRARLLWLCNRKVEIINADDVYEYYKVYRTEARHRSLSCFHYTAEQIEIYKRKDPFLIRESGATQSDVEPVGRIQQVDKENIDKSQPKVGQGKEDVVEEDYIHTKHSPSTQRKRRVSFQDARVKMHCWTKSRYGQYLDDSS